MHSSCGVFFRGNGKYIVHLQVLEKKKPIEECCEGFIISPNKTNCIPVCQNNCEHGTCVFPNICKCDDNYGGPYCNKSNNKKYLKYYNKSLSIIYSYVACPPGKFGEFCTEKCQCENGSPCDPYDGQCKCLAGWTGVDCSEKCSPHNFGINCVEECPCKNGAICDPVTGKCDCPPGFRGPL